MAYPKMQRPRAPRNLTLSERIAFSSQAAPSGCILWTGATFSNGYGVLQWEGKARRVHRIAWIAQNGPIPDGMVVCHRCDTPLCVNVDHLFIGTDADNIADKVAKGRQPKGEAHSETQRAHCARGERHPDARFSVEQIHFIRSSPESGYALAKRFGVSQASISAIRRRKTWTHV